MFDVDAFRAAFPEFRDLAKYPNDMVSFWGAFAVAQVSERRWKTQTVMGQRLYTAHEITLAAQNVGSAIVGGTPGNQSGPTNSKTVGSVTVAYDTQQGAEKDAGYWNLTTYGKQFIRLARIFGAGATQL